MKLITIVTLFATASIAAAVGPAWYKCDPAACAAPNCMCPSLTAPGGIAAADTPQFVLITHDDAITPLADGKVRSITNGHKNANGCNVPATWFVTSTGTECELAKKLLADNHEIALHTVNHPPLSENLGNAKLTEEIMGAKKDLTTRCALPADSIVGFRSPYLVHNQAVRSVLAKGGLMYDSSIVEYTGEISPTSKSFAQRIFPYTMDFGIAQDCNWTTPSGTCTQTERYPGLWEVPMWDLPNATVDTEKNAYTMDPDGGFGGDLLTLLKTNFDQAYNGNRAPFPIFVHAPWFTEARTKATNEFIEYALSKPNVFFVTVRQMLEWMKAPVPAAQVGASLKCNVVELSAPTGKKCRIYTVQPGDYLDLIAGKFGLLNSTELAKLNPEITPSSIKPGQTMKIPPWDNTCGEGSPEGVPVGPAAPAAAPAATPTTGAAPVPGAAPAPTVAPVNSMCPTWTVEIDQTLTTISQAVNVTIADLVVANGFANANVGLQIGQVLKVPPQPECCKTNSCVMPPAPVAPVAPVEPDQPQNTGPQNALKMEVTLKQAPSAVFTADGGLQELLAQVLGMPMENVAVTTATARRLRRARALLQAAATPTTAPAGGPVTLTAIIATEDPDALLVKAQTAASSGQLASSLAAAGVELQGEPTFTIIKAGVPTEVTGTAAPNAPEPASEGGDDGLSTAVIAGIAAGAAVAAIAAAALAVIVVRRRRAAAASRESGSLSPRRSPLVGAEAQLQVGGSSKI